MKAHIIIEQLASGASLIKEAFLDYEKAVITCGIYNSNNLDEYKSFSIVSTEICESTELHIQQEKGIVFITDENNNRLDVEYFFDEDGEVNEVTIEGTNIEFLNFSDSFALQIYNKDVSSKVITNRKVKKAPSLKRMTKTEIEKKRVNSYEFAI
jgi:hypothetical protein